MWCQTSKEVQTEMMDTLRRMAGRAKGAPDVGTLFHGMLAELAHHCNFDSRKPASGGSAGGRLLVTWTGTTSWHRCSHLLPSGPCMGPGDPEVTSPTPGTSPVPPSQVPASSSSCSTACWGSQHPRLRVVIALLLFQDTPPLLYLFLLCFGGNNHYFITHFLCSRCVLVLGRHKRHRCRRMQEGWTTATMWVWHCSQDFKAHGLEGDKSKGKCPMDRMVGGSPRCCSETFSLLAGVLMLSPAVIKAWFTTVHTRSFK